MEPRSLLLVDDCASVRLLLRTMLEGKLGLRVWEAENGAQALALLAMHHPSIIVTDLEMPHMNGSDFCAALAEDECLAAIPVVIFSGRRAPLHLLPAAAVIKPDVNAVMQAVATQLKIAASRCRAVEN
jgi:CheY-like chemotaxis protein